jgi:hypothetical protein
MNNTAFPVLDTKTTVIFICPCFRAILQFSQESHWIFELVIFLCKPIEIINYKFQIFVSFMIEIIRIPDRAVQVWSRYPNRALPHSCVANSKKHHGVQFESLKEA